MSATPSHEDAAKELAMVFKTISAFEATSLSQNISSFFSGTAFPACDLFSVEVDPVSLS
jgi:hypothetical protein